MSQIRGSKNRISTAGLLSQPTVMRFMCEQIQLSDSSVCRRNLGESCVIMAKVARVFVFLRIIYDTRIQDKYTYGWMSILSSDLRFCLSNDGKCDRFRGIIAHLRLKWRGRCLAWASGT